MSNVSPFPSPASDFRLTDVGNAARYARDHGDIVRHADGLGFLVYDGTRWTRDAEGEVLRLARDTVRGIYAEAGQALDEARRKELASWARASDSYRGLSSMVALAASEPMIACHPGVFDRDSWKLNTASGIVDLSTGECSAHDPKAYITRFAPTFYRPSACPQWLTFLDKIMLGRLALIEFLQRAVGYSLTGATTEQVIFILIGLGANGKTTYLEVLRSILGDYSMQTPGETLLVPLGGSGIPNALARLKGARFVTVVETDDGRRLAEGLVKQMTGGDTITARFLHREFFEFRPQFKVWLATNHKPQVWGTDYAVWRRLKLVPFDCTIAPSEMDKDLTRKLLEESTGILAWAVEGCLAWQRQGLGEPDEVTSATAAYREEMDPVAQFITDCCVVANGIKGYGLYPAYQQWSQDTGRQAMNALRFSLRLQERGFLNERDRRGRHFVGIGLSERNDA